MAPVDPQAANSISLGPVLDLIERWQQLSKLRQEMSLAEWLRDHTPAWDANEEALWELDIPALRALAEQHAAQLRRDADDLKDAGIADVPSDLNAAANFLCAPRCEPEAE